MLAACRLREKVLLRAGSFEIVVKGRLNATLDRFKVSRCERGLSPLTGSVPDQARLCTRRRCSEISTSSWCGSTRSNPNPIPTNA
jgi:hypothetical protein